MIKLYRLTNKDTQKNYYFKVINSLESRLKEEMNQSKKEPSNEFQNELLEVKSLNNLHRFYRISSLGSYKNLKSANKKISDLEKKSKKPTESEDNVTGSNSTDSN